MGRRRLDVAMTRRARRSWRAAAVGLLVTVLATACAGPTIEEVPSATATRSAPTETTAPPTAAVGRTSGSACESGKLRFSDLRPMDEQWQDGLAVARGRALDWHADAMLVELRVACELFEPGFRWQATYYSREAQAFFSSDTGEIIPVEVDPDSVQALPEDDIRFLSLEQLLESEGYTDDDEGLTLESLRIVMSTRASPVGPPGVPPNHAIAHVRVTSQGEAVELYVDLTVGGLYRYGEE